jgi:predicted metal-dependent phosphoesterase TrpH
MRIDLHSHSTASDGTRPPAETGDRLGCETTSPDVYEAVLAAASGKTAPIAGG